MAKTDKNILNIGKLYDILSQIKTKISSRFTDVDTAIAGKKASGASSISNSSTLKTLKKLELDADGKIVSGSGHTEFQTIGSASTPSAGGVGSSKGILKLQDKLDSSRENAVTPNAVKQALDAFESYIDFKWLLDLVSNHSSSETLIIEDIDNSTNGVKFTNLINAIINKELTLGVDNLGTWVGCSNNSSTQPSINGVDQTINLINTGTYIKFTLKNASNKRNLYAQVITNDFGAITHFPYRDTEHNVKKLKFDASTGKNAAEAICTYGNSNTQHIIGILPPSPSTMTEGLFLGINSSQNFAWQSPYPAFNSPSDNSKVLRLAPVTQGSNTLEPKWLPPDEPWGVNLNTRAIIVDHSDPDPNPSIPYCYLIDNLQNFKTNVVTLTRHGRSNCYNRKLKIIPPTISNPNDIYKYNFWIRLTTTATVDTLSDSVAIDLEMDGIGYILDQYDLEVNHASSHLSTRRIKATKINDADADYKLNVQAIGPKAYPDEYRFNQFSSVLDVVVDRQEVYNINTAEETYQPTLDYIDKIKLNNDYKQGLYTNTIYFPSAIRNDATGEIYCIPYHYLIKVTGDVLKIYRLQPPA